MKKHNTLHGPQYHVVPSILWRKLKKHLPKPPIERGRGRPRVRDRDVFNGIWYVLWSGCQWKAVKREWFGVSASTLHERFQTWQQQGYFDLLFTWMVRQYARRRGIGWTWQSVDSKLVAAPLGGTKTGKNPTDRGKRGAKIHLRVDQNGAPLSIHLTAANENDLWSVDDLVIHIVVQRPYGLQHLCADKGYDYPEVQQFVKDQGYQSHIKHRRRRGEPKREECPIPGEVSYPARRWVVEATFSWLAKRRSIRTRWCKKADNWIAFLHLACADILRTLIFG